LPHAAIAKGAQRFGYFVKFRVKALFNNAPRVVLYIIFHVVARVKNTSVFFINNYL
jgi:hypothetical protein